MPIHEPTGAWTTQHTYTTSNCTTECVCKCGLRIVIIACWFYSFSSSSSSSCNLIVHLSLCRYLSAQRFNSIVKITHKGFHISVTLFAHTYSHSSSQTIHFHLLNWLREMCREFALIYIILIFIIFFVLAQTNSDKFRPFLTHSLSLSRSSHTHTGPFIPSFTLHGWLDGWLAVWTSPFHFYFFFSFALRLIIALKAPKSYEFSHTTQQQLLGESARGTKRTQKSVDEMKTRLVPVCFMACILFSRLSNCRGDH